MEMHYTVSHSSGLTECKKLFKDEFQMGISDADCEGVRRVCEAVSTRAARLAGAGVVALVEKIGKIPSCTVAVDGSLYKKHPLFPQRYVRCLDHPPYIDSTPTIAE